jgi:hypothetical protein
VALTVGITGLVYPKAPEFIINSKSCGGLGVGQSCAVSIAFMPTFVEKDAATLSVAAKGGASAQASLGGVGAKY